MERLLQEWQGRQRGRRPLACMVIDLDEFKQVNDAHGHDVGDAYLKQVRRPCATPCAPRTCCAAPAATSSW
jgi:diguanylate cyclase (GGDEF)-like protein